MSIQSRFSSAVFRARKKKKLFQSNVAEAVSITVRWYQRIEKGERLPSSTVMFRLIEFLEINAKDFREAVDDNVPVSDNPTDTSIK